MAFQRGTQYGMTPDPADDWREIARCRDLPDPELMWPVSKTDASIDAALEVCAACPVRLKCLIEGAQVGDWDSIRGGIDGWQRARHHKAGLTPEAYPLPEPRLKSCVSCNASFRVNPERPQAKICGSCAMHRQIRAAQHQPQRRPVTA